MIRYSIVIPTKDRVDLCNRLISTIDKAVVASKLKKDLFELIVVDDSGVKHPYKSSVLKPHVLVCRKNAAHARNCGAKAAKGAFIVFLDDDVVIPEDYFKSLDSICRRYSFDILGARLYPMRLHAADLFFAVMMVYFRKYGFMPAYNLVIRKSLFDKVRFDDTSAFAPVEDYKYFFDVMKLKPVIYHSRKLNVTHESASYAAVMRRIENYSKGRRNVHKTLPKDYPQLPMNDILELNDDISYKEKFKNIGLFMRFKLMCLLMFAYMTFLFYNRRILADRKIIRKHLRDMVGVI